jgi:hypothetical protein
MSYENPYIESTQDPNLTIKTVSESYFMLWHKKHKTGLKIIYTVGGWVWYETKNRKVVYGAASSPKACVDEIIKYYREREEKPKKSVKTIKKSVSPKPQPEPIKIIESDPIKILTERAEKHHNSYVEFDAVEFMKWVNSKTPEWRQQALSRTMSNLNEAWRTDRRLTRKQKKPIKDIKDLSIDELLNPPRQ